MVNVPGSALSGIQTQRATLPQTPWCSPNVLDEAAVETTTCSV